ncbi:hypothetical protein HN419_02675 [Candidatus Woesearchaeota archaeon]|jgi:competence protein ComEC|nr:hypothetical protein [Candidatus Woesearchaeota archaeon]MBT3537098.1 hypothetical protein [Candidatus Woesearchaeota archaeon]MBT4697207.1 hypothetical protein [Candidatus Woesearchaeota archaeon]MBT4716447.1 hypothetical protein [Candidatus Woesearchaeota archaeon]MBT7106592.1 hypothetical protein [Candidatus Woesearchaeota archaeon]
MRQKRVNKILILLFTIVIITGLFFFLPLRCNNYAQCEKTWHKGCNGDWNCLDGECYYFCNDEIAIASNQTPSYPVREAIEAAPEEVEPEPEPVDPGPAADEIYSGDMQVHFIDVDHGSSVLIETPKNHSIIIDAGSKIKGKEVTKYIIQDLNYNPRWFSPEVLITSVMEENHVAGMTNVLFNFQGIEKVFDSGRELPYSYYKAYKSQRDQLFTRKLSFDKEIDGIDNSIHIFAYVAFEGAEEDKDENFYSVVLKLTYLNSSFLFASNCNAECEEIILEEGHDLSADILKISTYGDESATTDAFLEAVNPKVAVISVGTNDENLPHQSTIDKLEAKEITILRTDENGHIVVSTNGNKYKIKTEKS